MFQSYLGYNGNIVCFSLVFICTKSVTLHRIVLGLTHDMMNFCSVFQLKDHEEKTKSFVWGFTPYHQYFGYSTVTVHKSLFLGLFLTSTLPVHCPDTGGPVVVLFS